MTGPEIARIRSELGFTQAQLAQLLGVHVLTVSKWERGVLEPSPHQAAFIQSFAVAQTKKPDIGKVVVGLLVGAGVALALYALLKAAFQDGDQPKP